MLTKEECLKALCRIQCGAKRNKKCEDCKCFDTKINPWKCVENTNESLIIRDLVEEHFNHKPLQFKEIKKYTWIWDNKYKNFIRVDIPFIDETNNRKIIKFKTIDFNGYCKFEENRFYPIQIPKVGGEK